MTRIAIAARLTGALLVTTTAAPAMAALTYQPRTGPGTVQALPADSNKCLTEGPRSAYVGGMVANTGAATATNVSASLTGLNANVYLAGGEVASRAIGSLDPGESIAI